MRNVSYNSTSCYNCSQDGAAILCLARNLLADGSLFLPAIVLTPSETINACGCPVYRYIISYDETLLADPTYYLVATDISGVFCEDCLTDWIQHIAGESATTPEPAAEWVPFTFTDPAKDDQATSGTFGAIDCNYKQDGGDLLFSCNFHFTPENTVPQMAFNPITLLPAGDYKERIFAWAVEAPSSSEDAGDQQLACRMLVDINAGASQKFVLHRSDDAVDNTLGNNHYEFQSGTEYQISFSGRARRLPEVT